ncbi:hypothetical protein H4R20_002915 [Coemansia guatemalensis]|uniref:MARVEL domain-containing protein n=1 Tax=Coemansia guatemalensis TaxID=2761395 RepID=A0A9W8I1L5_9FUNG|nr:hypothetical protein H4R20_002915 [Coemansia guatemalensis]
MGLAYAGSSIFRTLGLAFIWPLAVIEMIFGCLVAATGHWKPRAVSIWTAIISALTILTIPLLLLGKTLRLTRLGGARCTRMWELILTGLWLATWVWLANQLNKFHCSNPRRNFGTTTSTSTPGLVQNAGVVPLAGTAGPVGFSLYGHALASHDGSPKALESMGMELERALGRSGSRHYTTRCRIFKAMLAFAIPIFAILALDVLSHMWWLGGRNLSRSASVSSVSSVESPGVGAGVGAGTGAAVAGPERAEEAAATETKV